MKELLGVVVRAAEDAARAETGFADGSLRAELRAGSFEASRYAVAGMNGTTLRALPASWALRLDPARVRRVA